jgi:hypothetical protein
MTEPSPHFTPPGNPELAWLVAMVAAVLVAYGFAQWIWPLGQFGPWAHHWPCLKDGIRLSLQLPGSGTLWRAYHAQLQTHGYLTGLYGRLAAMMGLSITASIVCAVSVLQNTQPKDIHIRGLQYIAEVKLATRLARQSANKERRHHSRPGLLVHPDIQLTADRENLGFLAVGPQGSGKTQWLMQMLLQLIPPVTQPSAQHDYRLVIFDKKGEYTQSLPAKDDDIILLAPWDARSAQWAIANDLLTRSEARLFSEILIRESGTDPMWGNASRQVLTGLIHYLSLSAPGKWGFADLSALLNADAATLARILPVGNPETRRLIDNLLTDGRTAHSVFINSQAFLSSITDLADAWCAEGKRLAIGEWLADDYQGPRILMIQGSARYKTLVTGLLNAFLSIMIAHIVEAGFPEARQRKKDYRLFFFLDECPKLGKIHHLDELITVGRAKGVRALLGFQDLAQPKAIYGPEAAATWCAMLSTQFYGRTPPGETANWISSVLGSREIDHPSRSLTTGHHRRSRTLHWQRQEKRLLLPSQLATDLAADADGITALLQCTGWPHLYRLQWPITPLAVVRPASVPASWTLAPTSPPDESPETRQDTRPTPDYNSREEHEKAAGRWQRRSAREPKPNSPEQLSSRFEK